MTVTMDTDTAPLPSPRQRMELVLGHLDQLPTLPALATRLLAVTTSGESSARDVVEIIESDAAMTAAVLRMVRRADLGLRTEVLTVARAVTALGFTAIRNLVFSLQLFESFRDADPNAPSQKMLKELWRHNLAVACVAESIAEHVDPGIEGEAFVCGLLHDIGKIALGASLPKSYARIMTQSDERLVCICDIERETFGLDHTIAGRHLTSRWGLPQTIVECVWLHHQPPGALPPSTPNPKLIAIVHLADSLVRHEGIGYSGYLGVSDVRNTADRFGLTLQQLEEITNRLPDRMKPIGELIGLDETVDPLAQVAALSTANRKLLQVNEELMQANRQLEIRSEVLVALERFVERLDGRGHMTDVCAAASACVKHLVSGTAALAFVQDRASDCVYVGSPDAPPQVQPSAAFDPSDAQPDPRSALTAGDTVPGFSRSTEHLDAFWRRIVRRPQTGALWSLPLKTSDAVIGAVLVHAPEDTIRRFRDARAECEVLSAAFGKAVAASQQRADAQRTTEELADLNRRLHAAQEELVRTRSVSMISAMAAGAAHELNNPLSVISGRAQMAQTQCRDEETKRTLQIIVEQTQRATGIVTELMAFAKPAPPDPAVHTLAQLLDPLCQHWRAGLTAKDAEMALHLTDPNATVFADQQHLRLILGAIVSNAIEAVSDRPLHVQINSPSRLSDEKVRIVVMDNGVGMTRDVMEHAIDPFFSSRTAGRGRGLGLSRAFRLTEINGGRLWLDSKPSVGTTVTLELPARPAGADQETSSAGE